MSRICRRYIDMGTLISPGGQFETVTPANGKHFRLDEVQTLVGGAHGTCLVEAIYPPVRTRWDGQDIVMVLVDEEGLCYDPPLETNARAMMIDGGQRLIVGNALLIYAGEFE
jgi:hypothetical protein